MPLADSENPNLDLCATVAIRTSRDGQLPRALGTAMTPPRYHSSQRVCVLTCSRQTVLVSSSLFPRHSSFIVSRLVLLATRLLPSSPFLYISHSHHHTGHVSCTLSITSARFLIRHEHGSICIARYRQTLLSRTHQSPAVDCLVFCPSWQRREISHIVTCTTWSYACTLGGLSQYDFYLRICAQHYSIRTPHTTI